MAFICWDLSKVLFIQIKYINNSSVFSFDIWYDQSLQLWTISNQDKTSSLVVAYIFVLNKAGSKLFINGIILTHFRSRFEMGVMVCVKKIMALPEYFTLIMCASFHGHNSPADFYYKLSEWLSASTIKQNRLNKQDCLNHHVKSYFVDVG